ncbi:MAG: hypothetical protein J5700_01750 [Treponema sp.]|nr:hypothetical protein [Treponema sp.]
MKKLYLTIAALCAFALCALAVCSCVSSRAADPDAQGISVSGLLQTNDVPSYFIILGAQTKSAQTFFLVKDAKNAVAWKSLKASVGKNILVKGKLVSEGSPWLKTVAVTSVSLLEE